MDPSLQNLLTLLTGLGNSTTRLQRIDDFQTFILDHIPYGQVSVDALQTGLMEFDGPKVNSAKPQLQWHSGGLPFAIDKAARIHYSYTRYWDGTGSMVNATILLGLQSADGVSGNASTAAGPANFAARVSSLIQANSSQQDVANALLLAQATTVITGSSGFNDITSFLQNELGWNQVDALRQTLNSLEFDGPAQDNNSHNPFAYTLGTLFNKQELYNELLWWYFGGQANRVTKAIRVPLPVPSTSTPPAADAAAPRALSLLIG